MSYFKIQGGIELSGEIIPQGAKNEALQIIASSILVQNLKIKNCPRILDVENLLIILEKGGASIKWDKEDNKNILYINTINLDQKFFESEEYFILAEKLRGSIMLMGPLLARFGYCFIPKIGGDKIGLRPIDTHLQGFSSIGAKIENNKLYLDKSKISKEILLEEASVTGTANIVLASFYKADNLIIYNAACETYITSLCQLLDKIGLEVKGLKSNRLVLSNKNLKIDFSDILIEHEILPDFIEVASFISLAMATRSEILIKEAGVNNLGMTLRVFEKFGASFEIVGDDIRVLKKERYKISRMYDGSILKISSEPWPKVSPDILSVAIVASLQGDGSVLFHEKMFESRLFFVDKLISMGADVILCDPHRALVNGKNWQERLRGKHLVSPDIRAGIALLIASLGAEGESIIDNIKEIDRGYERLEERLLKLGAKIERVN